MSKRIKFGLSSYEVNQVIKEVHQYKQELIHKVEDFTHRLADNGVVLSRVKIMQFPAVYTGELLNSINNKPGSVIKYGSEWIVYTGCSWAPYVEFGTGIVGSKNPHPDTSLEGWKYDINDHGDSGWYYYKDGEWHYTKGMPSRPFMYDTARDLSKIISKVAREVFD